MTKEEAKQHADKNCSLCGGFGYIENISTMQSRLCSCVIRKIYQGIKPERKSV